MKVHDIKTVQDMIDCTNEENIDRFLSDLKSLLLMGHHIIELGDGQIKSDGFTWIDDGVKHVDIILKSENK